MRSFKPGNKNIDQVLSQHLVVPKYQRPYTWGVDEINQLWEDLQFSVSDAHFLGIIVLHNRKPEEDVGVENASSPGAMRLEIIDGQQRLITITIILALLRNLFKSLGKITEANALDTLITSASSRGPAEAKLLVSNSLAAFFEQYIQKHDIDIESGTHKEILNLELSSQSSQVQNVIRNYRKMFEKITVNAKWKKDPYAFLLSIREKILDVEVIEVTVNSEDDAFDLFETLNSRLVRLSEVDMIKNRLFMKLSQELGDDILEARWGAIVLNAAGEKETPVEVQKFINYFWWSREKKVPPKEVFRVLKQRDATQIFNDLESDSIIYEQIISKDSTIKLSLSGVDLSTLKMLGQILNLKQINIPLLALCRKLSLKDYRQQFHNSSIQRLIEDLERFIIAYKFSPRSPSAIEGIYSDSAQQIFRSKNKTQFNQAILDFQKKLNESFPTQDEFRQAIQELKYKPGNSKNNRMISYLFEKTYLNEHSEVKFDETNIDHIFPQSPVDGLLDENEKLLNGEIHTLGNLTALGAELNRECSNKRPFEKVDIYKKSLIPTNISLADEININGWTAESIELRTTELHNKIWDYLNKR